MAGYVEVQGLREFQQAVRRSVDTELPKRLGQANREVGARFIRWLEPRPDPAAVGTGAGATVRPSATRREVILRAGGKHRAGLADDGKPKSPRMQWGRRPGRPVRRAAPPRPYIRRTAERRQDDIGDLWLAAVARAMDPAFHRTEP